MNQVGEWIVVDILSSPQNCEKGERNFGWFLKCRDYCDSLTQASSANKTGFGNEFARYVETSTWIAAETVLTDFMCIVHIAFSEGTEDGTEAKRSEANEGTERTERTED